MKPVLTWMGEPFASPEAAVMLLAIAGQESGFRHRRQSGGGPARGWWQFELAGIDAVFLDEDTDQHAFRLVEALDYGPAPRCEDLQAAIEHNDQLACALARLLLYADPHPLPHLERPADAWECYTRCWRPGRPRPADWPNNYNAALQAVRGEAEDVA